MADLGQVLGRAISALARRDKDAVLRELASVSLLPDDELRRQVRGHLVRSHAQASTGSVVPTASLIARLLRLLRLSRGETPMVRGIALASAAFARAPADLPPGSTLREEQIEAVVALARGRLLQMDTGEGKTYALMVAALTMLERWPRVYVLTPNEYLCERDARRARPFFDFVGVSVGLCTRRTQTSAPHHPEWGAEVVYTTVTNLTHKRINDDLDLTPPQNPIVHGAVLLDEVDAILLDEESDLYNIVTFVKREPVEWQRAFALAGQLTPDDVLNRFSEGQGVYLTPKAWRRLADDQVTRGVDPWTFGRLVEAAYTALHVVRGDVDYVLSGTTAVVVNQATGLQEPGRRPEWLAAVHHLQGLPQVPKSEELFSRTHLTTLKRFGELAGASGTAGYVLLDMFLSLGLKGIPSVIAPTFHRFDGQVDDLVFIDTEHAFRAAAAEVVAYAEARPVLVGALSRHDAYRFVRMLHELGRPPSTFRLVLEGETWGSEPFAHTGEVGALTITTLFAARGTDIVLSSDAVAAGGLHLVVLGRTREGRLDRQFLGRAGRQGQPFSARFFNSVEMDLLREARDRIRGIYQTVKLDPSVPIDSKMVSRSLQEQQAIHGSLARWRLARKAQESELRAPLEDAFAAGMTFVRRFREAWLGGDSAAVRSVVADPVAAYVEAHVRGKDAGPALSVIKETVPDIDLDAVRACVRGRILDPSAVEAALISSVEDQLRRWAELEHTYTVEQQAVADFSAARQETEHWVARVASDMSTGAGDRSGRSPPQQLTMEQVKTHTEHWRALCNLDSADGVDLEKLSLQLHRDYAFSASVSRTLRQREPPQALKYAVIEAWRRTRRELARGTFDIESRNDPPPVQQYRRALLYQEAEPALRDGIRIGLLNALLRCGDPARNDELFRLFEERVPMPEPEYERSAVPWASNAPDRRQAPDPVDALISSFVATERQRGQASLDVELLVRKFLHMAPWPTLGSGSQAAAQLARWSSEQRALSIPHRLVREQVATLSRFLEHAADHHTIPEAPKQRAITAARGVRILSGMRNVRAGFGAVQLVLVVALLLALGFIRPLAWGIDPGGAVDMLDRLLLWGSLGAGSLAGPWLALTAVFYALRGLHGGHVAFKAAVVSLACAVGALLAGNPAALVWVAVVFPASILLWRYLANLQAQLSLAVDALLIASSALFFVTAGVLQGDGRLLGPTTALVAAVLLTAWLSRIRVPVSGGHVTALDEAAERREGFFSINPGVDLRIHALVAAITAVSWSSFLLLPGAEASSPVTPWLVYAGCYGLVATLGAWRTLRPGRLADLLHARRVELAPAGVAVLGAGRVRAGVAEIGCALAILGTGIWIAFGGADLALSPVVLVPACAVAARAMVDGGRSLLHTAAGTSAGMATSRQLRAEETHGRPRTLWRRLRSSAWVGLLAIYTVLVHLLDAIGVLVLIRDAVQRLFGGGS